jgi:hypothetical protein
MENSKRWGIALASIFLQMALGSVPHVLRGGFGTMPAFSADYFGSKNVGPIYGAHAHGSGLRQRHWPTSHRSSKADEWKLFAAGSM